MPAGASAERAGRTRLKQIRVLLLYAVSDQNATFSYQQTWPCQLLRHSRFSCTRINLAGGSLAGHATSEVKLRTWHGDAVVLLHSVFSNACLLNGRRLAAVQRLPQPKAFFIGNEYKLMPQKMQFCEELPVRLLVSQSSSPDVHRLYRDRLGCEVVGIPNSGLDPEIFQPWTDPSARPIDLGYRADDGPMYLGHTERHDIADFFGQRAPGLGLSADISLDPAHRFTVPDWAAFLNRCKGQLGTEAGGDFFELTDRTRTAVNSYLDQTPHASFDEVWQRFFRDYQDPVPLRIISSRNVEAAGTRTVQILFEGRYDGYFEPDEHYIPLKKDFSNADQAIEKLRDPGFRQRIADQAHDVARSELTYTKLLDRFAAALEPLL